MGNPAASAGLFAAIDTQDETKPQE